MEAKEQMKQAAQSKLMPHEAEVFQEQLRTAPFFGQPHKKTIKTAPSSVKEA